MTYRIIRVIYLWTLFEIVYDQKNKWPLFVFEIYEIIQEKSTISPIRIWFLSDSEEIILPNFLFGDNLFQWSYTRSQMFITFS